MGHHFESVLNRLVATYESGRLVPFIGSGMSRPACSDWTGFVQKLEACSKSPSQENQNSREDLIRRANTAVRKLKGGEAGTFVTAVRTSLSSDETKDSSIPPQTVSLARIWWPLVLSTNYDNCYSAAFAESFPNRQLQVVGRSSE